MQQFSTKSINVFYAFWRFIYTTMAFWWPQNEDFSKCPLNALITAGGSREFLKQSPPRRSGRRISDNFQHKYNSFYRI